MPAKRASKQAPILPNELWLEIFSKIDTDSLLDLTLVCRHWNELIFTHMADRFVLNIDMDQRQFPKKATGMVPDRHYRHLCLRSFRLDTLDYQLKIVKRLVPNLNSLKLHLVTLDCQLLEQLLALCTRIKELEIKAKYFEYGEKIYNRKQAISSLESVSIDIENRVSTFKSVSLEMALIPCIPNVQKLTIVVHDPLDLVVLESLAPRLDNLMAIVSCEATNKFLSIQLPALTTLDLRLKHPDRPRHTEVAFERTALQQFLLECKKLRNFVLDCEFDDELLSIIFNSLPRVRTLKLYSCLTTQHFSLNGLEKMVNLKILTLQCLLVDQEIPPIVPMPTVEKVTLNDYVVGSILVDILRRFPNVKDLSFPIRHYGDGDRTAIAELAPQLENLCLVDLLRVRPDLINDITQLTHLKTLTIAANTIARGNFRLFSNIIVLPTLKILTIRTFSNIPTNISRAVAAKNPSCKLILNMELVQPPVPRVVAGKRKRPAPVASSNPSAPSTGDESQPSGSGASTSGSSSNLSVASDMDRSNVSFSTAKCSSPTEKRMFLEVSK